MAACTASSTSGPASVPNGDSGQTGVARDSASALADSAVPVGTDAAVALSVVKCEGINSCKGTSECASATNACHGQNDCAGHGFISVPSEADCTGKGGKVLL